MNALIWTYRLFCTSQQFLAALTERLDAACDRDDDRHVLARARIVNGVKSWIERVWVVLKEQESVAAEIGALFALLRSYGMKKQHALLRDCWDRVVCAAPAR